MVHGVWLGGGGVWPLGCDGGDDYSCLLGKYSRLYV